MEENTIAQPSNTDTANFDSVMESINAAMQKNKLLAQAQKEIKSYRALQVKLHQKMQKIKALEEKIQSLR
ncbi:hypothetical protein [Helicobacter canis]|uniref:Uncharacterized protein n=1 Tax=Helicobacter canis NCTC 12740 TaxID=1357399 RepID=V8CDX3_9HELI|nr:hypothetical protein [Helicobacter canis]ETD25613.1 hypothetical protein HMPREF2087_01441 [Helicobacter canis NCTC 12740]